MKRMTVLLLLAWISMYRCEAVVIEQMQPAAWSVSAATSDPFVVILDDPPEPGLVVWNVSSTWRGTLEGVASADSNTLSFAASEPLLPGEPVSVTLFAPGMTHSSTWRFSAAVSGGSGICSTNSGMPVLDTGGFAASNSALRSLCILDLNRDDQLDLAVPVWNTNTVYCLENDGAGTLLSERRSGPAGIRLLDVTASDIDQDGGPDLMFGAGLSTLTAATTDGAGVFTNWMTPFAGASGDAPFRCVERCELNGDGLPDALALAEDVGSGAALWCATNLNGTLIAGSSLALSGAAYALDAADVNGDGYEDALVAGRNGFVGIYTNSGQALTLSYELNVGSENIYACRLLDVNGDGLPEIAVAGSEGRVAIGTRSANAWTFETLTNEISVGTLYGLAVGDLDGNGTPDLAAAGGSNVIAFLNDGSGHFSAVKAMTVAGESLRDIELADFNGDQTLDMAVCGFSSGRAYLFLNIAGPTYNGLLESQTGIHDHSFEYTFPTNTFTSHADGELDYELEADDGGAAPVWLTLDAGTRRISAVAAVAGEYALRITARDADGRNSSADWQLSVCFSITVSCGPNGQVVPSDEVLVTAGGTTNFVITPDTYYHVDEVFTNEALAGAASELIWSNITENGTLQALFEPDLAEQGTPHWWLADYALTNGGYTFDQAETNNPDNDPHINREEYIADTNPNDSEDWFQIDALSRTPPITVYFQSSSNRLYSMKYCSALTGDIWTNVPGQDRLPGTGGADAMTDTNTVSSALFYRLMVEVP